MLEIVQYAVIFIWVLYRYLLNTYGGVFYPAAF